MLQRGVLALCLCPLLVAAGPQAVSTAETNPPPSTLPELQERFASIVSQPKYRAAMWGLKVVSLASGRVLVEHNAEKLFSPASNAKLYTVALGLHRLGPDYRIKTSLYAERKPDDSGRLESNLIVYGRGDPCINARLNNGDIFKALEPLARALTNAGVRRIQGSIVADCSFLRGPELGSGWAWDDQEYYYGAEICALTVNDNTVAVQVKPGNMPGAPCLISLTPANHYLSVSNRTVTGENQGRRSISVYRVPGSNVLYVSGTLPLEDKGYSEDTTVENPAGLFAELFAEALARHGVKFEGQLRCASWLDRVQPLDLSALVELGYVESLPMRDLAREIHKPSQNLYTDLLLGHLGERLRQANTPSDRTSEELGIADLNRFIVEAGIKRGDVLFEEGSGLSRNNIVTPNATVRLLEFMARHPCAPIYEASLPVAGVDGTLRSRMKNTAADQNVKAKTGTLRWANSLSGYVTTAGRDKLAFCFMLNRFQNPDPNRSARADLDDLAVLLADYTGKTE